MKLASRLFVSGALPSIVALMVSGILSYSIVGRYLDEHEREQLEMNARNLAEQLTPYMLPTIREAQVEQLTKVFSLLGDFTTRVYDNQWRRIAQSATPTLNAGSMLESKEKIEAWTEGAIIASSGSRSDIVWHVTRKPGARAGLFDFTYVCSLTDYRVGKQDARNSQRTVGTRSVSRSVGTGFSGGIKTYEGPLRSVIAEIDGQERPVGYIELRHLSDHTAENMELFPRAMLLAGIAATIVTLIFTMFSNRAISIPLADLTTRSYRIASGDFSIRASPARSSGIIELRILNGSFDSMAAQVRHMIEERDSDKTVIRGFFDDAAHEMRTPLSAISNYVELLQGAAAEDEAARIAFLADCGRQIERLEWINKNLLSLARLDSRVLALDEREWPVDELLREAMTNNELAIERNRIRVGLNLPPDRLFAYCDRSWMSIALSNILDNAIKYSPQASEIELGAGVSEDGNIALWVKDRGQGIGPEHLPHVFERFYRGKSSEQGSGLGLAMAKSIADRHSGKITVESELGLGSTVTIRLPAHDILKS